MGESASIGRPLSEDVDWALVRSLLLSFSVRQVALRLGIHRNTIYSRLRSEKQREAQYSPNPFCITDRTRMRRVKSKLGRVRYRCRECGQSAFPRPPRQPKVANHRMGRPPRPIDCERASELLQRLPFVEVASILGVGRNLLYYRINKAAPDARIVGRPFRTLIRRSSESLLYWPYMKADDPRYDGIIKQVNDAVPRTIADEIRSDICQELVASVLMGDINQEEIKAAVRSHLRRHYKMFPVKGYQTISLDAPLRSNGQGGQERRLIDVIDAETYQEKIQTFRYGSALADCATASELAKRLAGRWEADRLKDNDRRSYSDFRKPNGQRYGDPDYERLRRKYKVFNNSVHAFQCEPETFGGAWSVETALPEELCEESVA